MNIELVPSFLTVTAEEYSQRCAKVLAILIEGHCPADESGRVGREEVGRPCGKRLQRVNEIDLFCPRHQYWRLCRAHQPPCLSWSIDGDFQRLDCPAPAENERVITCVRLSP